MKEIQNRRVALYYPLGKKNSEWTGGGGAQRRLSFLFSHMSKEKISPTLVYRVYGDKNKAKEILSRFIDPSCNLVIVGNNIEAFIHFAKSHYDCIAYANQMTANLPAVYGAIFAHTKRLLIFVTVLYSRWKFNNKLQELLMLNNIILSNRLDCLYPQETEQLQKRFLNKRVTATPCSFPNLKEWLDKSEGVKKENKMVFASRMVEEKNPMLLFEAIDLIKTKFLRSGYLIQICGDGPLEDSIKKRIEFGKYSGCIQFLGRQDMAKIMPQAKVFFSLQEDENYPSQSLLEAISCGCFCIATDCGDTGRIVKDDFGVKIPKDSRALACAINVAISMTEAGYAEVKRSAQKFARKTFDPQNAITYYEEICEEICRPCTKQ